MSSAQSLDRMKKARKTMGSNENAKLRWALAKIVVMVNDYRKYLEVDRAYSIGVLDDIGEVAKAALRKPSITM